MFSRLSTYSSVVAYMNGLSNRNSTVAGAPRSPPTFPPPPTRRQDQCGVLWWLWLHTVDHYSVLSPTDMS